MQVSYNQIDAQNEQCIVEFSQTPAPKVKAKFKKIGFMCFANKCLKTYPKTEQTEIQSFIDTFYAKGGEVNDILFGKANEKLSDEAISILKKAKITETDVVLQSGTIKREIYEELKDTLGRIGGTWKSQGKNEDGSPKGKIVFDRFNPKIIVDSILKTGLKPTKNPTDYFPTPEKIVQDMIIGIKNFFTHDIDILEPSAGTGGIADIIRKEIPEARLDVIEYLLVNAEILKQKGHNLIHQGDFLKFETDKRYDFIVMNPPFDGTLYIDHIRKAQTLLKNDNDTQIIAITPDTLHRTDKKTADFWEFVGTYGSIEDFYKNKEFKESGTNVNTLKIVVNAPISAEWKHKHYNGYANYFVWLFDIIMDNNDMDFRKNLDSIFDKANLKKISQNDFSEIKKDLKAFILKAKEFYRTQQQILLALPDEYMDAMVDSYLSDFLNEKMPYHKDFWKYPILKLKRKLERLKWIEWKYAKGGGVNDNAWRLTFDEYLVPFKKEWENYTKTINAWKRESEASKRRGFLASHNLSIAKSNYPNKIQKALSEGKYQQAIANGEMTRDRAIEIIQSAGLPVPQHIVVAFKVFERLERKNLKLKFKTFLYRIHKKDGRIKHAGTGKDSWFNSLDDARKDVNYEDGERIFQYANTADDYPIEVN